MSEFTKYRRTGKGYVISALPRRILAARLKVEMDGRLGRSSPPTVKRLARIKVPLIIEPGPPAPVSPLSAPTEHHAGEAAILSPNTTVSRTTPITVTSAEDNHSGHVTLYLPKELNAWLRGLHDESLLSYPDIVLNAISWAASAGQFGRIFARDYITVPANDIFGRKPAFAKNPGASGGQSTRPVRFRKEHMQVIVSLARTWTADNRNAFFVGVLRAYRAHLENDVDLVDAHSAVEVRPEHTVEGFVSEQESDSLDETDYLLRSPRNAHRLLSALEAVRRSRGEDGAAGV